MGISEGVEKSITRRFKMKKIAVAYDKGQIFQHFGKTEEFKVYEIEDGKVVSSQVIGSNGAGHGALAEFLSKESVEVLICGGIGGGAQSALADAGIEIFAGAKGDADAAVDSYLKGELEDAGVTCDHHDHEGGCGHHDHGEGGCCGGHGHGEGGCCH